jgi:hypothetical protein
MRECLRILLLTLSMASSALGANELRCSTALNPIGFLAKMIAQFKDVRMKRLTEGTR